MAQAAGSAPTLAVPTLQPTTEPALKVRPFGGVSITTVGGMVPLALAGATSIGLSYTSFALTLIGGMSSATLLTLALTAPKPLVLDATPACWGARLTAVAVTWGSARPWP